MAFDSFSATVSATVSISICGNRVIEEEEVCDMANVNGKSCENFGYDFGELRCGIACDEYDLSLCSYNTPIENPQLPEKEKLNHSNETNNEEKEEIELNYFQSQLKGLSDSEIPTSTLGEITSLAEVDYSLNSYEHGHNVVTDIYVGGLLTEPLPP